jgi:hypothetical protein
VKRLETGSCMYTGLGAGESDFSFTAGRSFVILQSKTVDGIGRRIVRFYRVIDVSWWV